MNEDKIKDLIKLNTPSKVLSELVVKSYEGGNHKEAHTKYNCPNCHETLLNDRRGVGLISNNTNGELGNFCKFCGKSVDWGYSKIPENSEQIFSGHLIDRINSNRFDFSRYTVYASDENYIYHELKSKSEMKKFGPYLVLVEKKEEGV